MTELGQALGQAVNERDSIRSEQVKQDTVSNYFVLTEYRIMINKMYYKSESQVLNDAFMVGHSTNGVLGTSGAGGNDNVLGESTLGAWTTIEEDNDVEKVTNACLPEIAKWLNGETGADPTHVAIGTSGTAYNETQTELGAEVQTRVVGTMNTDTSKIVQIQGVFFDTAQSDVLEVGVFTASTDGIMYFRKVISDLDMAITSRYRFTVKFAIQDGSVGESIVVDEGLNELRDWMGGGTGTAPTHMEWNDGTSSPYSRHVAADWDDGGSNEDRNANSTNSRTTNIVTFEGLLSTSELNSVDITKTGTFNGATNGNLFGQTKYGAINKTTLFQVYEIDRYIILGGAGDATQHFIERFGNTTYQASPTTANWDTTNLRLAMDTSDNHSTAYNTVATFSNISDVTDNIISATLTCTETKWNPNDVIKYFLSANGGSDWEEVTRGTAYTFTNVGNDLRARILFLGNGGVDTYIEDLEVRYTT